MLTSSPHCVGYIRFGTHASLDPAVDCHICCHFLSPQCTLPPTPVHPPSHPSAPSLSPPSLAVVQPPHPHPQLVGTQCRGDLPTADLPGEGATGPLVLSGCHCTSLDSEGTLHWHLWSGQGLGPGPALHLPPSKVRSETHAC